MNRTETLSLAALALLTAGCASARPGAGRWAAQAIERWKPWDVRLKDEEFKEDERRE